MGGLFNPPRSEFLSDVDYSQRGGCFITTRKAIAYLVIAIISIILVISLMYFYGQNKQIILLEQSNDIEKLLEEQVEIVENIRLSNDIVPLHYRLRIHPILDSFTDNNFTFTGKVSILLKCNTRTNKIILNSENLDILETNVTYNKVTEISKRDTSSNDTSSVTIKDMNGNDIQKDDDGLIYRVGKTVKIMVLSQRVIKENARYVFELDETLEPGMNYTIDIQFKGLMLENSIGLYRTSYKNPNGTRRWIATTHFQPIYARRVFPCFDEPEFKASFEISVSRMTNMTVLSNMPLKETEPMPSEMGWVWDHFKVSPPMSTYLVAFTISDFKSYSVTTGESSGPVIKVWAPSHIVYKTQYALKCGVDILKFFEIYFNVKYPLPKLDLLAVPNFEKGAMENWGIISFRDLSILWDPQTDSWDAKKHVFSTIAYELSHQWFGNLVTIKWWSEWWLNEGFASYMSDIVQYYLEPTWDSYDSFPLRATQIAFGIDELKSTESLHTDINNRLEIEQILDYTMSEKGSSLLRMVNSTFEEINFRKAVHVYLNKWSYNSTNEVDFWNILQRIVNTSEILPNEISVEKMMNTWTNQKGFPLVTINRTYDGHMQINQRKFLKDNSSDSLWIIPLTYITESSDKVQKIFMDKQDIILPNISNTNQWILFNVNQSGYYRVNYDQKNWKLLIAQLDYDHKKIPVTNRGQLFNDAFELSSIGLVNYTIPYKLLKHLYKEENFVPWAAALNSIEFQKSIFINSPDNGVFQAFMAQVIKPVYDRLGAVSNEDDSVNDIQLRDLIVEMACEIGYKPCLDWAKTKFQEFMETNISTETSEKLREVMYCTAVKLGDEEEFYFLWNRTIQTRLTSRELRVSYLGMGCTREPWLIMRYIESSLDGSILTQNIPYVWLSISHAVGQYTGLQFLRENWDRVLDAYKENYVVLQAIIEDFLNSLSTESDLEDLTTFYKNNEEDLVTVAAIMKRVVNKLKLKIKWRQDNMVDVVSWLKSNI